MYGTLRFVYSSTTTIRYRRVITLITLVEALQCVYVRMHIYCRFEMLPFAVFIVCCYCPVNFIVCTIVMHTWSIKV